MKQGTRDHLINGCAFTVVTACVVVLGMTQPAQAASVSAMHPHCVHVTHLKKPESLNGWFKRTGVTPAEEIRIVARCDGLPPTGGWPLRWAKLLNGSYGPNIDEVKLPPKTDFWAQI